MHPAPGICRRRLASLHRGRSHPGLPPRRLLREGQAQVRRQSGDRIRRAAGARDHYQAGPPPARDVALPRGAASRGAGRLLGRARQRRRGRVHRLDAGRPYPAPVLQGPARGTSTRQVRAEFGVDDSKPPPEIWLAASIASVQQGLVDGPACDSFSADEFARAMDRRWALFIRWGEPASSDASSCQQ
jgi:hypothetical protein